MTEMIIQPIGGPARHFLRLARIAGGTIDCGAEADRRLARDCAAAGYLRSVAKGSDQYVLTRAGELYLDKLARAN